MNINSVDVLMIHFRCNCQNPNPTTTQLNLTLPKFGFLFSLGLGQNQKLKLWPKAEHYIHCVIHPPTTENFLEGSRHGRRPRFGMQASNSLCNQAPQFCPPPNFFLSKISLDGKNFETHIFSDPKFLVKKIFGLKKF